VVVWRQVGVGAAVGLLRARTYDAASVVPLGTELPIDPANSISDTRNPRVAVLAANQFVVTWEQANAGATAYDLRSTRGTSATWLAFPASLEVRVETVSDARLVAGPNQTALALWRQNGTLYLGRLASGIWSQPVQVGANLTGTSLEPHLAADGSGNAILVWVQQPVSGTVNNLYYAYFTAQGGGVSAATAVAADAVNSQSAPSLDVNPAGAAIVAWLQSVGGQATPDVLATLVRP